jgi:NADPH-dependent 2,4-dienoyl-CoA reductase/sulfur reductase-like enzyme
MAEGLRAQRVDVHYLMRGERYWPDVLSESESRIIERRLASRGIRLHPRTEIARILGSGGRVVGVETTDGTRIACEIVGVSIGVAPNKSLAEAVGLECGRGVLVDDRMQTSEPDIFAAGDVAETIGSDERPTLETLWNSAVAQGRVAGANMATEATARQPESVALNVTQLAGLKCMFIGTIGNGPMEDLKSLARGDSDIWRRLPDTTRLEFEGDHSHVRLELLGNRIVGAVVVGEQKPAYQLQAIVVAQADVSSILDELKRQDISSARALERFAEEWRGPQHVQA